MAKKKLDYDRVAENIIANIGGRENVAGDISFTLPVNSITGFIGTNGSGKTTTIKAILNLIKIDSGTITLYGNEFSNSNFIIKNSGTCLVGRGLAPTETRMNTMFSIFSRF